MSSPEGERRQGINEIPPKMIVYRILSDRTRLGALLDGTKNRPLLKGFKDQVGGYSPNDTTELVGILLTGLGSNEGSWNADTRYGALQLLGAIPFENKKVKPEDLLEKYLAVLEEQKGDIDPLGSPYSLAGAGLILVPHFPPTSDTLKSVRAAWDKIQKNLGTKPEWSVVERKYSSLETSLARHKQDSITAGTYPDGSTQTNTRKSTVKIDPELPGKVADKLADADERVRDMCASYFGIDKPSETQREIGQRWDLTQPQVSLVINGALKKWGLKGEEKRARKSSSQASS